MGNKISTKEIHVIHCFFCDKTDEEVERLVAGADVYICNECIDIAHMLIHEED